MRQKSRLKKRQLVHFREHQLMQEACSAVVKRLMQYFDDHFRKLMEKYATNTNPQ